MPDAQFNEFFLAKIIIHIIQQPQILSDHRDLHSRELFFKVAKVPHNRLYTVAEEQRLETAIFSPYPVAFVYDLGGLWLRLFDVVVARSCGCSEIGDEESALAGEELLDHFSTS